MPLSFSAPREEAPYLHSRTEPQQRREKSLAPVFAPSQTSWVASGDVAAPAMPVEPQREAVWPIFLTSCNNSVPFSPLSNHILNGLVSVGSTLERYVPGSVGESFIALPPRGSYHVSTRRYIHTSQKMSNKIMLCWKVAVLTNLRTFLLKPIVADIFVSPSVIGRDWSRNVFNDSFLESLIATLDGI